MEPLRLKNGAWLENQVLFLRQRGSGVLYMGVYWVESELFPMGSICSQLAVLNFGEPVESLGSRPWQTELGR